MDMVWASAILIIGIILGSFMLFTLGMWLPEKKKESSNNGR